jgi:hypothetical protein
VYRDCAAILCLSNLHILSIIKLVSSISGIMSPGHLVEVEIIDDSEGGAIAALRAYFSGQI